MGGWGSFLLARPRTGAEERGEEEEENEGRLTGR